MDNFWKAAAGTVIALILILTLDKRSRDLALVLILCTCIMVGLTALSYLREIVKFIQRVAALGKMNQSYIAIMIKTMGIGMISEIISAVCRDAGNDSVARMLEILGYGIIVNLSLPVFADLLNLIQNLLGAL